jgi:hypothetical protein
VAFDNDNSSTTYDYFNQFLAAAIVTDDNTRYPLWTRGADGTQFAIPTNQDIGDLKALCFLTEVTIENNLGYIPRITATLNPPYEDAIRLLDSTLVEFGSNRLEVQFGYARSGSSGMPLLSPVYQGLMLKPDIAIGAETTIVLNAQGVAAFASHLQEGGKTFTNMTRMEIIAELCDRFNMVPNADAVHDDSESFNSLSVEKITYSMGWNTPWFCIVDLCKSARCWAFSRGIARNGDGRTAELVIQPRTALAVEKPPLTLTMFQVNRGTLSGEIYPVLSAGTDAAAIYLPGVQKIMLKEIDLASKKIRTQEIADSVAKTAQNAIGGVAISGTKYFPDADATSEIGYIKRSGDPASPTAVQQARAAFESHSAMGGIPLEIESLGIPSIEPGQAVAVNGLGLRLDVNYGVHKVIHSLGVGGFTTRLSLISNTTQVVAQQFKISGEGPANSQKPDNEASGNTAVQPKADGGGSGGT